MSDESSSVQEIPSETEDDRVKKDASSRSLTLGAALSVLVFDDDEES
jgi:hypothetical protein